MDASQNIDLHDRQKRVKGWQQEPVSKASVLVVGAGALGNEIVKLLVQLGAGSISLVDFDTVDKTNLNRCVYFSREDAEKKRLKAEVVAEKVAVQGYATKITPIIMKVEELDESFFFQKFSCAFSALDNINARLHLNAQCYAKIPVIDGGTTGFLGKVQVVRLPSSCLECAMSRSDYKLLWRRYSCAGEALDFLDPKMPAISTTTSVVAALQVAEFLKLVMPSMDMQGSSGLVGKYLLYNGLRNSFDIFEVPKRKGCPVHLGMAFGESKE